MKKYNPHSNRTRSRLVPAPKTLIVAAGTIRTGTVYTSLWEATLAGKLKNDWSADLCN